MFKRLYSDPTDLMDLDEGVLKGLAISPPRKVDKPTYEIVGPVERFDFRDNVIARKLLQPSTPEYDEYYSRHPETKVADDDRRRRANIAASKRADEDLINEKIAVSSFYGTLLLSHPDIVNTPVKHFVIGTDIVETGRAEIDPKVMSRKIKALALQLGAAKVGITELNQNWVYSHFWSNEPVELDYKYIICMAFLEDPFMQYNQTGLGQFFEVGFRYAYGSLVSSIMGNLIRNLGWRATPLPNVSPYLVVPTFIDAGIGEQGRCGIVITKEFGNAFRPGAVATDMPLATDKPVDFGLQDFCEKCQICVDTCPSKAIPRGDKTIVHGVRKWKIDDEKCYTYWNTIGHPCGICQLVCPWNHPNNLVHNVIREMNEKFAGFRSFAINADKFFYKHKPGREPKWMTKDID